MLAEAREGHFDVIVVTRLTASRVTWDSAGRARPAQLGQCDLRVCPGTSRFDHAVGQVDAHGVGHAG